MGTPAALLGDPITGICPIHLLIGPLGVPAPTPGLPFNAPLLQGVSTKTLIQGKPVVLVGCTGLNTPPHVGLHPSDPNMAPPTQIGTVVAGSTTVMIEGRPAAPTGATCTICNGMPGVLVGSSTVLVG
jgi:uncharacterized Zn-binding protein involved in type VI secretion